MEFMKAMDSSAGADLQSVLIFSSAIARFYRVIKPLKNNSPSLAGAYLQSVPCNKSTD
jgi:hypothetical protein